MPKNKVALNQAAILDDFFTKLQSYASGYKTGNVLKINRLCLIAESLIKQHGFCSSVAMNSELNIVTDAKTTYFTKKFRHVSPKMRQVHVVKKRPDYISHTLQQPFSVFQICVCL